MKLMKWIVLVVYVVIILCSYAPVWAARIMLPTNPPKWAFMGLIMPTMGVGSVYYAAPKVWYAPRSPYWKPNQGNIAPNGANLSGRSYYMNQENVHMQHIWKQLNKQWHGARPPARAN